MNAAIKVRPTKSAPYLIARLLIEYTFSGCARLTSKVSRVAAGGRPSRVGNDCITCLAAELLNEEMFQRASNPLSLTVRCVARKRPPKLGCGQAELSCAVVSSAPGAMASR